MAKPPKSTPDAPAASPSLADRLRSDDQAVRRTAREDLSRAAAQRFWEQIPLDVKRAARDDVRALGSREAMIEAGWSPKVAKQLSRDLGRA